MNTITSGLITTSATGAAAGTLDTSAIPSLGELSITVQALSADKTARVSIEDSALGNFTDAQPVIVWHFSGPISAEAPVQLTASRGNLSNAKTGSANNKLRANVLALDAGASITFVAAAQ